MTRQLHLNAFLMGTGHHEASGDYRRVTRWRRRALRLPTIAQIANADVRFALPRRRAGDVRQRRAASLGRNRAVDLAHRLGARHGTRGSHRNRVHVVQLPVQLARRFSALDHVSNGRAGWNIVTTAGVDAARNFGVDEQPLHAERYARGRRVSST